MSKSSVFRATENSMEKNHGSFHKGTDTNRVDNNRVLIPKNIEDLENEALEAKEYLDYLEMVRAKQHGILVNIEEEYGKYFEVALYPEYEKMLKQIGHMDIELSSELDHRVLKIRLDYLLPIYHKTKNVKLTYYKALQDIYQRPLINKLIRNQYVLPNFYDAEKVFVLIVQYFKNNKITDLDNRFHSFIFNALRSSRITSDDSWQKLSYMEDGRKTEQANYTEIYVGNFSDLNEIIELSHSI